MTRSARRGVQLLAAGVVALGAAWAARRPAMVLPAFAAVRAAYRPSDVQLLDRDGVVVHELRIDPRRRRLQWTALADVSAALQAAVIASEDRRFYRHAGVDGGALLAAGLRRLAGGRLRGASTISMQLAALLDAHLRRHGEPRSLRQKWRQMRAAWALERRWSKAEILEAYLNLATFRGELQGAAAAASVLFGKAPHGVNGAEALVLAVLLKGPNADAAAVQRRAWALRTAAGVRPGSAELAEAVDRALRAPAGNGPRIALAPHVAHALLRPSAPAAPVQCTLDTAVQRFAIAALRRNLLAVRGRHVQDGAVLVADNASGDVLAYVGSSGDLSRAPDVDGVRARRQPGSALKPLLYALAFDQRLLTPASLLADTPLELAAGSGLYRPQDYDEQFRGLVSVRTALAGSLNVPAVRTLQLIGAEAFVQQLRRLGFAGLVEGGDYYGPSLALGSGDVSVWELTDAYRTLANGGVWSPLRLSAAALPAPARRVYSPAAAFLVSSILADRGSRSVTFGLDSALVTRFWTAVKTGTSKEMRDNWCVGYSRRYTVGVWVGNFSGAPMEDVSGVTGAAPVWVEVMSWLHRDAPSLPPDPPAGVVSRRVAFPRGVEPPRAEWFLAGTEPSTPLQALSTLYPRIVTPVSHARIALDPDIPAARQRVAFEARPRVADAAWVLDGRRLGAADRLYLWRPRPGRHQLALVDPRRRQLDRVTFVVRGVPVSGRSARR